MTDDEKSTESDSTDCTDAQQNSPDEDCAPTDANHHDDARNDDENDLQMAAAAASAATRFRINARCYFITWSRCPAPREAAREAIKRNGAVQALVIAQENHQDLGKHLHAIVQFQSKHDCRNARAFDLQHDNINYHPNIVAMKGNWRQARTYITKEDQAALEEGEYDGQETAGKMTRDACSKHALELAKQGKLQEAQDYYKEHLSATWLLHGTSIITNLEREFPQTDKPRFPNGYTDIPALTCRWTDGATTTTEPFDPALHTLVLHGAAGIGKTQWALNYCVAHGRTPLRTGTADIGTTYNRAAHGAIIWDDADLSNPQTYPRTTLIQMFTRTEGSSWHCRYRDVRVQAGTWAIVCTNEDPVRFCGADPALWRRIAVWSCGSRKLFEPVRLPVAALSAPSDGSHQDVARPAPAH